MDPVVEHFGVKGQKWGVRKKREVSPEKQAKREAKAKPFEKKSEDLQRRISAGDKRIEELNQQPKTLLTRVRVSQLKQDRRILEDNKEHYDKTAEAKREGKLTPTQKKLLIGGAVIGGLVVAGVAAQQINSGQFRQNVNRGKEIVTGKKFEYKKGIGLKGELSVDDIHSRVVRDINRDFPTGIGSNMNCRRCTFTYEMRRRGYDVAATKTPTASGQNATGLFNVLTTDIKDVSQRRGQGFISELMPDKSDPATRHIRYISRNNLSLRKFVDAAPETIFERLSKEPERSRGELGVFWKAGGGHSMAYEIINGQAHIFDGQTGEHYGKWTDMAVNLPEMVGAGWTRLDNVPLDTNFLQRWVKNAK